MFTGSQGWSSITYNPVAKIYLIVFQVKPSDYESESYIAAMGLWTTTFKPAVFPQLVLYGSEKINGTRTSRPIINPYLIYNPLNGTHIDLDL